MLQEITIKNFKSIADDTIQLGRVNVFIGENGCGKSNILEAVGFASAININMNGIIENELLVSKGIRIAKPDLTFSSFKNGKQKSEVGLSMSFTNDKKIKLNVCPLDSKEISTNWFDKNFPDSITENLPPPDVNTKKELNLSESIFTMAVIIAVVYQASKNGKINQDANFKFPESYRETIENLSYLSNYVIYSLNTLSLRGITQESHKEPVGIYGENLDVLIANLDKEERIKLLEYSYLIDWFEGFMTDEADLLKLKGYKLNRSNSKLYFTDKYLVKKNNIFSAENANEGILHVLFYLSVLISKRTPKFFAIDNIESCLNPHLCRHLMKEICTLAKENDKQLLITTHNPAILDGLNLFDDEIRLFTVQRNKFGQTKAKRIKLKPDHIEEFYKLETLDLQRFKLSELWTRGFLGAISDNF